MNNLLPPLRNEKWSEGLDDFGGIATDYCVVGDILGDYGTGGYDGIAAYGDTRTDDGSDAYPRILPNGHLTEMKQVVPVVEIVINSGYLHLGTYQHIVFYHYPTRREDGGSLVDDHILPDGHPASAIAIEG